MSRISAVDGEFINLTALKERGWTIALVGKFLGNPDKTKPNPFYRSGSPQKLYSKARVEQIEAGDDFRKKKDAAKKRSQAALVRAEAARQRLIDEAMSDVVVEGMSFKQLRREALESKEAHDQSRGDFSGNHHRAAEQHIHRWMVNYARHELSNYDSVRERFAGRVGVHDAAEAVRSAVLEKIAKLWPELQGACRQAERADEYESY